MPEARRRELLRVAGHHRVTIIEDDPYWRLSADPLALVRHRIGLRLAEYARACTRNQAGTRPGDAGTVRPVAQP